MVYVAAYHRIHHDGSGPGTPAISGTYQQNVRLPGLAAQDKAGRVVPRQIQPAVACGNGRLEKQSRGVDIPRQAELARARVRGSVDSEFNIVGAARSEC